MATKRERLDSLTAKIRLLLDGGRVRPEDISGSE